jgi:hypothetical protein
MDRAVECITLAPAWYGGAPVEPGTPVSLSESEAAYAVSIGRVERVPPAETTDTTETEDPPET